MAKKIFISISEYLPTLCNEISNTSQTLSLKFRKIDSFLFSSINDILKRFNDFNSGEQNIIEVLITLNIDRCTEELNASNHINLSRIFSFAKYHLIEIREDFILNFYLSNIDVLLDENAKISLKLFIQLLTDNLVLIDEDSLSKLLDFFEKQSFEIKNELLFILSDLYLLKANIFSDDQTETLLEHIYTFCLHSQYQLLDIALDILNNFFNNESVLEKTRNFIYDLTLEYNSLECDSHYIDLFIQYCVKNSII